MGQTGSKPADPITQSLRSDPTLSRTNFPSALGKTLSLPCTPTGPARTLGYEIYGQSTAPRTILYFHGTPGTRLFFTKSHSAHAASHNVRILVPERPGYGLSTPDSSRTLLSSVDDLPALLDAFGVRKAWVVGYSAGGPFALAFAKRFPERCESVAVVSGLSPNVRGVMRGMTMLNRVGYFLARRAPGLLRMLVGAMVGGALKEVYEAELGDFSKAENAEFAKDEGMRRCFAQATMELYARKGGFAAEARDYSLMAAEWGFDLEEVRGVGVWLYGGGRDDKCTRGMFDELERGLGESGSLRKAVLKEEENHLYFFRLFEGQLFQDIGLVK